MKIVAISDTHRNKLDLPKADVLIHSGDWSSSGATEDSLEFIQWLSEIKDNYKKIICVPGNHDIAVQKMPDFFIREFKEVNAELLIDQELFYRDTLFYGSPWTNRYGNWGFVLESDELNKKFSRIPEDTNVLITHGPAKYNLDLNINGEHCGSEELLKHVMKIKPQYHFFGHIHESSGIKKAGKVLQINASCLNDYYQSVNGFKTIYI